MIDIFFRFHLTEATFRQAEFCSSSKGHDELKLTSYSVPVMLHQLVYFIKGKTKHTSQIQIERFPGSDVEHFSYNEICMSKALLFARKMIKTLTYL